MFTINGIIGRKADGTLSGKKALTTIRNVLSRLKKIID